MFWVCILQTLYRVILNWPDSMDSIERRELKKKKKKKKKAKTATLQLITSAHVWKKVYTLRFFSLNLIFFFFMFQFLQSSLVCQTGGALWRRRGWRDTERRLPAPTDPACDQAGVTSEWALMLGKLEPLDWWRQVIWLIVIIAKH